MASSRKIGNVYAELSVKDSMTKGLKSARASLNKYGKTAAIGAAAATAALTAAMAMGTKRALDLGGRLSDVSAQTGINVASVMKLERAYNNGGVAASRMGADVARMQKTIVEASQGGNDPFTEMGLSAAALLQMDPAAQFDAIGNAIMRITNPAERNAKAMEIFGRSGAKLMTVFGQLDTAARDLGKMPEVAERFANSFDRASDIIGNLPAKSDSFFVGFTSGIIGQLLPNLEKVNKWDFTELGENIGDRLSVALEILTNGDVWKIFALQAEKAIATIQVSPAMNNFAAFLNAMWDGGADGGNFTDNFEKYANAGIAANTDIIDDLDARISEIFAKAEMASKAKKDAAAASGPTDITQIETPPIVVPVVEPAAIAEAVSRQLESTSYDVNSYQRRGLSLDASPQARAESRSVSIMEEIRNILRNAESKGEPLRF